MRKPDPKKLLEDLCKEAHPRTEASLRLIFEICQEQETRGSNDYSVATIGKLASAKGGPGAPAIRNKTGEKYRALMASYADHAGGRKKKGAAPKRTAADDLLEGVSDPVLRTRINLLMAELEASRAQLLAARHLASQNAVLVFGEAAPSANTVADVSGLTFQEKKALSSAISDKTLEHWGWSIDKSGRVLTEHGQVIFGVGYISAIKKIIS